MDIYAGRGPKLDRMFPWGRLERGPGGDKLYRKRPHRFAFAPRLALASLYGEASDRVLHEVLLGWMAFASGRANDLAYDSNLAVIQRTLALSWAWAFLAARGNPGDDGLALEGLVLQVLHQDVAFLAPRLGHSHANNHLLADGFAGWFLGFFWAELSAEYDLKRQFEPLWLRELERQTLADGTSFEHSTHYHEYACEMAASYTILSRRNDLPVPEWVLDRTRRLLQFQVAVAESSSYAVAFGDAAEDPLFPLDGGDGWATAAWPDVLNRLFSGGASVSESSASRERAFWLLGGALSDRPTDAAAPRGLERYALGGYYRFRDNTPDSALIFRTGPKAGEACSPGHMHADLMSIYATANGREFLVDAGTFTYRRASMRWPQDEPDWRGYFSGPSAHNALAIDGHDPLGAYDGDFRKHVRNFVSTEKALSDPLTSWVDARIEGEGPYAGYRRGVIHVPGEYWIVYDLLPRFTEGEARSLGFQFGRDCRIARLDARDVEIRCEEVVLLLTASSGLSRAVALTGSRQPLGGWVSRVYGELAPAPQVRFRVEATETSAFLARFLSERGEKREPAAIEVERLEPDGLRLDVGLGPFEDTLMLNLQSSDVELNSRGTRFRGELARVRRRSGRLELVHWLNGRSLAMPETGLLVESEKVVPSMTLDSTARLEAGPAAGLTIRWPRTDR